MCREPITVQEKLHVSLYYSIKVQQLQALIFFFLFENSINYYISYQALHSSANKYRRNMIDILELEGTI